MKELENKLQEVLVTNAPFQLPEKARKWIATYAWVFALIGFILGALGAIGLFMALVLASVATTTFDFSSEVRGYLAVAWISLVVLVVSTVVLGVAMPKLKQKQAMGWQLIFYLTLGNFAASTVIGFADGVNTFARDVTSFIWNVFVLLVSLYFIFQVRSHFKKAPKATTATKAKKTTKKS